MAPWVKNLTDVPPSWGMHDENKIEDAFRYIRNAIELEPKVVYLWGSLGTIYRRAGFLHEAELFSQLAAKARSRNPYYQYKQAQLDTGDLESALEFY